MDQRKAVSLVIVIGLVSVAIIGLLPQMKPPSVLGAESKAKIVFDPFNQLDWCDVAWNLGKGIDFLHSIQAIASYGPRFDGTTGYSQAAKWIVDTMNLWGIPTSNFGPHQSVLGHQTGYGNDSRAIVFGAHLDSAESGLGVDQNAGGCAVVMMIAKILSQFRLPVNVYYCFFAGNMQFLDPNHWIRALYGSKEISQYFVAQGVNVIAFYNYDELLYYSVTQDESRRLLAEHESQSGLGYHSTKYLADLLISFMRNSGLDIMLASEGSYTQTDHLPFEAVHFPSVNVKSGHTYDPEMPPPDILSGLSFNTTQAILVARASASVAVYLAMRGNDESSSQRMQQSIGPLASVSLRAVMTIPQTLTLRGSTSNGSSLQVTVANGSTVFLPPTQLPVGKFLLTSDSPCPLGLLTVTVINRENKTSDITLYAEYVSDTDGNGIPDSEQYTWPPPNPPLDWDHDGLSDHDEIGNGTDVFRADTDNDGMGDAFEVQYGLNPLRDDSREDADNDALVNIRELNLGTNPRSNDTEGDGLPDGWEVRWGTDPLVDDAALDPDNDTLTNIQEYHYGADPLLPDGDHDGVFDLTEVQLGMNPLSPDSDRDGLRDQLELLEHLNPLNPDYDRDVLLDGPDSNPRINNLLVLAMITLVPVAVGSILLWRRIR